MGLREGESLRPRPHSTEPGPSGSGGGSPGLDLVLALGPLLAISGSAVVLLDLPILYLVVVAGGHLGMAALLLRGWRSGMPGPGLGVANRVTLGRALLVPPVAAMVPWGASLGTPAIWWIIVASTLALSLDGVDGWVARSTGSSTPLGARFDMELDAFLLLALSLLLWLAGPLGPWVILIGALRYLFVAAGWLWPVLQGPLPESMRRKTVCVVQGVGLLVALGPVVPSPVATGVAATALAALVYSFSVDVVWLARQARKSPA